jgi:hypothetical protein
MDFGHRCSVHNRTIIHSSHFSCYLLNKVFLLLRYYAGRNRYEVEDVEEEEVSDGKGGYVARKKYTLQADAILPLPTSLPDPSKKAQFF